MFSLDFNSSTFIADGDKGFKTLFASIFCFAKKFSFFNHKKENLNKYGTKGDRAISYQCVIASSIISLSFKNKTKLQR